MRRVFSNHGNSPETPTMNAITKNSKKLIGKTALVTGSSRGIGRAIALRLAEEGARLIIDYAHGDQAARQVAEEIKNCCGDTLVIKADLRDVNSINKMVSEAVKKCGGIDILVNNAAIEKAQPFWEVSEEDFDSVLSIDLKGTFFASQAFARHLIAVQHAGKIINISSVHEELPLPGYASYCAAKGGVRMLTRTLAIELAPFGITVNGIAPGAIATDINADVRRNPDSLRELIGNIPLKRLGTPEDVAGIAAFLASSESDYVTGSTYVVDGGLLWYYEEGSTVIKKVA